jgi:16S rRNA (cytosine967-C5)-methyltransferase
MPAPPNIRYSQLKIAAEIWELIKNASDPADRWLGNYFHRNRKKIGSRDRRFLSETIYSCFRYKTFLQTWLNETAFDPDDYLFVLAAAAIENLFPEQDFQGMSQPYFGSSDTAVTAYRHLQAKDLPEAIRNLPEGEGLAVRYSFPLWLVKRWLKRFGAEECRKLLAVCQQRPSLVIRSNPLKISRDELIRILREKQFDAQPTQLARYGIFLKQRVNLFDSEEFRNGFFEVQDEGSQLLCEAIKPEPGNVVWDVCAGGGGKSLGLAALMGNRGRIIATDIRHWKLADLKKRAKRAGAFNIFPADLARMDEIREMKNGADIIVVDAPCSGSGTLRRNPDAKWKLNETRIRECRQEQSLILEKALPYLKKCGKLCYATCSLEPDENEEVVGLFLKAHPEMELVPLAAGDGFLRFLPQREGTDGFFMAAFRSRGQGTTEIGDRL